MKLFRLSILLVGALLIGAFQVNAQCSITNFNVTTINCVPNAFNAANNDYTICGTFTASGTSGDYVFEAVHQAFASVAQMEPGLAKDGVVSFCVTILDVPFIPEGFSIFEDGNPVCGDDSAGGPPAGCAARPACNLAGFSITGTCCDGNGGLRVMGNFTATNGSGSYNVTVFGIAAPGGFPTTQVANIQNGAMAGVVNFDIVFPNFDFTETGGGISIEDRFFVGCSSNTVPGSNLPANAGACTACPTAAAQAPIPTMSQWGLMIFGLLVLNLGVFFLYRKQAQFIK